MRISLIIPVYNEAENIGGLCAEIRALSDRYEAMEVLFVDDASTDDTAARIDACRGDTPGLRRLTLPRNQGQSAALLVGFAEARHEVLVTLDGDGQNDPADIPLVTGPLEDGADVVCGIRARRRDPWARRVGSRWANQVRDRITRDGVRDTGCSLKAFRRECAEDLPPLNGMHRFMPAYFTLHERTIRQVDVHHRPRAHGTSKYSNFGRLPRTVRDLFGFRWYRSRLLRIRRLRAELEQA